MTGSLGFIVREVVQSPDAVCPDPFIEAIEREADVTGRPRPPTCQLAAASIGSAGEEPRARD